ncbi:TIGR00341 family protein [Psychrobacter celer]|uniref:TIGR00341 family protein n=1 Tax=unclassified Psychrobacter TaxID=196806 RepID=UPI0009FB5BD7|nr:MULTISPECIES: TIGR00341 family protein [unclassified Psychrobacter]PJX23176.1 TIGR00341 family protein [Psychrobacter sp. L7]
MTSVDKQKAHYSSSHTADTTAPSRTDESLETPTTKTNTDVEPTVTDDAEIENSADNSRGDDNRSNDNGGDDNDNDMACAKPPESKISMESIAPDVVVATLETTDPDAPSANDQPTSESEPLNPDTDDEHTPTQTAKQASTPVSQQQTDTNAPDQEHDKKNDQGHDNSEINEEQQNPENAEQQTKTTDAEQLKVSKTTDKPATDDSDQQEDEIKEEKEAKLESYKQFAAEQFSNQKVDYPEVRVKIEANALPSRMYFIMNILSAIIASYGLVTNSAAVVIGAMLVAMMLGPITGVALAIIDHRMPLLRKSLITVLLGITLVLVVGFIVGWLHKDQPLTAEILSRTQPTSMDLMIALAGGTAGAYAMVSPHLSVAVVGVAVATALVPPLAASGILFANGEMQLGFGALLLAVTNIIAIQFTNALVLWVLGFRRLVDDDYKSSNYLTFLQRNAVTLLLLGGLGTYLTINLQTNAKQQVFESSVKEAINHYFIDKGNVLTNTQFDSTEQNQVVRAVIRGETTPSAYDVQQIETRITQDMAKNFPDYLPIKIQLRYLPVQVIESNPLTQDKLDKTDAAILTN